MEQAQVVEKPYGIAFKLPEPPPSVNSLYNVIFSLKKVELKNEVKLWKSKMKLYVPVWRPKVVPDSPWMYFRMDVHMDLFHKNGKVAKFDVMNMEKACIDMVCEKIGIDDKFISECHTRKIQSENEYVMCEIGYLSHV
jgi:Holliday junction resolvase RusA-like endonuclease